MKKFIMLLTLIVPSVSFSVMPTTDAELDARIEKTVKAMLQRPGETRINTLKLTRQTGAPLFVHPEVYNITTGASTPVVPDATFIIKPQIYGHPVIMTGKHGAGPVNSSYGFIELTRVAGGPISYLFEINGKFNAPAGVLLNGRQWATNAYENSSSYSIIADGKNLEIRNEYWGPTVMSKIYDVVSGWVLGTQ